MNDTSTPEHIMHIGMGFWASKTLLSAIELDVFTTLGTGTLTATELGKRLDIHPRAGTDFFDSLVSLGLLERDGSGHAARYRNTIETGRFLDRISPAYMGGMLEMANARLYGFWGNLTEALRTGRPQNEAKTGGDFFGALYEDDARLGAFLTGMQGLQYGNHTALLSKIDLSTTKIFCDVGGANGALCALVAARHPQLRAISFDLPPVGVHARRHVEAMGVADRVEIVDGDFFTDKFPQADVIVLGNVLHDWDEDRKQVLIGKAYDALDVGGRLIAIENVIDDDRRHNTFGLLMSLNMLIEVDGGFDYTGAQFDAWCLDAGFQRTEVVPLAGPGSAAIAYK